MVDILTLKKFLWSYQIVVCSKVCSLSLQHGQYIQFTKYLTRRLSIVRKYSSSTITCVKSVTSTMRYCQSLGTCHIERKVDPFSTSIMRKIFRTSRKTIRIC
uniref:Uncharacterized protein n=1 Tax=Cacopsylla melanoneura TaxID=428564 RepID=A0A8D8QKS6_9HEMI